MFSRPRHADHLDRAIGIDLLRGIAIALVLGTHLLNTHLTQPGTGAAGMIELAVFSRGVAGVTIFFVISGFLITRTTVAREPDFFALSFRRFYLRRASRILPLLAVSICVGIVGLALGRRHDLYDFVFHATGAPFNFAFWLSIATFTFNWLRLTSLGGAWGLHWDVLWSLAVEEQFYLLFPIVVVLARYAGRFIGILLGAIVLAVLTRLGIAFGQIFQGTHANLSFTNSLVCLDALAFGVLAVPLSQKLGPRVGLRRVMLIAGIGCGAATYFFVSDFVIGPFLLASSVALFLIGAESETIFSWQVWRPFAMAGELSYGLYLLHPLVLYLIAPLLPRLGFTSAYILLLLATVFLARFSFLYIEQPASKCIRAMPARPALPMKAASKL